MHTCYEFSFSVNTFSEFETVVSSIMSIIMEEVVDFCIAKALYLGWKQPVE